MLNQLSIRTRLAILAIMASLALLVLGSVNYWQTRQLTQALEQASAGQGKLRNQGEADMMHDAVRGDVLEMYYQASQANTTPATLDGRSYLMFCICSLPSFGCQGRPRFADKLSK